MDTMEKMERSMHVMVKQNTMMKTRLDELNGKQVDNEKVVKSHEEINARQDVEEGTRRNERCKIEQIKEQES